MNAQPHAIATALAHALADASSAGSVDAKGREGKGPDRTTPNGVFALGDSSSILSFRNARAASEPSDAHQPHATASAWMRAGR
jgi:hypothetical protein